MAKIVGFVTFLFLVGGAVDASATLYSNSGGYEFVVGNKSYQGHDLWEYGELRLPDGWYPFAQLGLSRDSYFDYIVAPGFGLQKGVPGWGKGRVGYTYYNGGPRGLSRSGESHGFEFGWFKALTSRASADLAYRIVTGELMAGINTDRNLLNGETTRGLRQTVYHEAIATGGYDVPVTEKALHLEGSFSAAAGSGGRNFYSQSFGATYPIAGALQARAGVSFAQSPRADGLTFVSLGLSYGISGHVGGQKP